MSSRDQILNRLKARQHDVDLPDRWRSRRHFSDLAGRFSESLQASKGEVHHVDTLADAWQRLDHVLADLDVATAVVNQTPPLDAMDWSQHWPDVDWHVVGQTEGALRDFCTTADVGISSAEAALAETGTIAISSGAGQSRLATLLPPVHVALVPTDRLVADIFSWVADRPSPFPANLTFVSGPSKTADIEQTLAVGVHGPKRFIVILFSHWHK